MDDNKIQWHPGFVAAMNLEFAAIRDVLVFEKEYNLNTKPLSVDLLVVKKEPSVQIENEIGIFFHGHNIMEYKSPGDHLGIDAFYKASSYASLYKSYGETEDEKKADREFADSVLEVSIEANRQIVEELKGDASMCQALMEIMEPQLLLRDEEKMNEGMQKGMQKGLEKGLRRGIRGAVDALREFGHTDGEIKAAIMRKYALTTEEADEYF